VVDGAGTVPVGVEYDLSGSAVSVSPEGQHSLLHGKNRSGSPVQFDVIIISDANSVSTCQNVQHTHTLAVTLSDLECHSHLSVTGQKVKDQGH